MNEGPVTTEVMMRKPETIVAQVVYGTEVEVYNRALLDLALLELQHSGTSPYDPWLVMSERTFRNAEYEWNLNGPAIYGRLFMPPGCTTIQQRCFGPSCYASKFDSRLILIAICEAAPEGTIWIGNARQEWGWPALTWDEARKGFPKREAWQDAVPPATVPAT